MREKESGVILFITYYYEGGEGGGEGELGNVKFLLSIRLGWGGGGRGEELRYHCAPSPH